jgi:hypothetical protein
MATANEKLVVYVPPEQAERLRQIAEEGQRSVGGLIRLAITRMLDAIEKGEKV